MQELLRHPAGAISTRVGFTGGENEQPTEKDNVGHFWEADADEQDHFQRFPNGSPSPFSRGTADRPA